MKLLIVYYTWSNGNTERIAKALQKRAGGDLEKIALVHPYTGDYNAVVKQGEDEVNAKATPAIQPLQHDLDAYDTIAIGTPTWWYTVAPAVRTFLTTYDLANKIIIPFATNGGWPGETIADIGKLSRAKNVKKGMNVRFDSTGGAQLVTKEKDIEAWLASVV